MSPLPFVVATVLFEALLLHLVPRLTRPDLFFAVTVAPSFARSDDARRIVARYRAAVWLGAALAIIVGALGRAQLLALAASQAALLATTALAFRAARRRVLPHAVAPSQLREASLAPRSRRLPGGWLAQLGPFALLAVAATRIGPLVPLPGVVIAALACALLSVLALALQRSSPRVVVSGNAGAAEHDFKRLALVGLLGAQYVVTLCLALLAIIGDGPLAKWVVPVVDVAFSLAVTIAVVRLGQGGTRRAAPAAEADGPIGDRTRDAQWKGGFVYVNRDDPALFVEKRFGIGYTLNFGNPWSWALSALIVGLVVASLVLAHFAPP